MAEARVEEVDGDGVVLWRACRDDLAAHQHLQHLADIVAVSHASLLGVGQRLEDGFAGRRHAVLREAGNEVHLGAHDDKVRARVEALRRLLELRQDQQREQERADDVGRDDRLVLFRHAELPRADAGVLHYRIDPLQPVTALRERFHRLVRAQVQRPGFDDVGPAFGRLLDRFFGCFGFLRVA